MTLILVSLLLMSCSNLKEKEKEIVFTVHRDNLEANTEESTCTLVKSINESEVKNLVGDEKVIDVDEHQLSCKPIDTSKLGDQTIEVVINNKAYPQKITVEDTTKPVIKINPEYSVEVGNKYFDLKNEIEVSDNFDQQPHLVLDGFYDLEQVGTYPIVIKAIDQSNNEVIVPVLVEITEKEKEVVVEIKEVPIVTENTNTNVVNENTSVPVVVNPTGPTQLPPAVNPAPEPAPPVNQPALPVVQPPVSNPIPASKEWYFESGYTFDQAFNECKAYRDSQMVNYYGSGSCEVIHDSDGVSIGYRASFK